jgi:hypothetical protein
MLHDGPWTYVPDLPGNRDDPEPLTVRLRPLTGAEHRRIRAMAIEGNAPNLRYRGDIDVAETIRACVVSVSGYEVNGKAIVDAETLLELGEPIVIDHVYAEACRGSRLTEGERKN